MVSMKVNTVEQFRILQFINKNFDMDCISLELVDRNTIKVTDHQRESMEFRFEGGRVVW